MPHEEHCAYLSNERSSIPPPIEYFSSHRHIWSRSYLLSFLVCLSLLANVLGNWPIPSAFAASSSPAHPKPGALTFQHYL